MPDITSNLIVYYPFDKDVLDYATGSGVSDVTNYGTTVDNSIFKKGTGSLKFVAGPQNSVGQYLQVNNSSVNSSSFFGTNGLTIALWIKSNMVNGSFPRIIDIGVPGKYDQNLLIYYNSGSVYVWINGTNFSIGNINDNQWHHVVWTMTYSNVNNSSWKVYVDNVIITNSVGRYPQQTPSSFLIGRSNFVVGDQFYNGYIDDFRIYQRVLTADDVNALYNFVKTDSVICFKEGSKILTEEGYKPVEELKKGDYVKTLKHGFKPIELLGKREIVHNAVEERIKDQLYLCSSKNFPELTEDLVLTGCHSILVDHYPSEEEREQTKVVNKHIYITDNKYRLPACVDRRTTVYNVPGTYTVYHLALENIDPYMNFGIYANGLLVESCSKRFMMNYSLSNMELIE